MGSINDQLFEAVNKGDLKDTIRCLEAGADINARNQNVSPSCALMSFFSSE